MKIGIWGLLGTKATDGRNHNPKKENHLSRLPSLRGVPNNRGRSGVRSERYEPEPS
jgi:hypothetical protein